jgi:hypothetical protein
MRTHQNKDLLHEAMNSDWCMHVQRGSFYSDPKEYQWQTARERELYDQ